MANENGLALRYGTALHRGDPSKLFVSNLPCDIKDEEIREIFSTYGTVDDVIIINPDHPDSKCAFVNYDLADDAGTALRLLNRVYRFRRDSEDPIKVAFARGTVKEKEPIAAKSLDHRNIYVSLLPMDITEDEVREIFSTYGKVHDVVIIDTTPHRGHKCAFLNFDTVESGMAAVKVLNGVYKFRYDSEVPIRVSVSRTPAHRFKFVDGANTKSVCSGPALLGGFGYGSETFDAANANAIYSQSATALLRDKPAKFKPKGLKIYVEDLPYDINEETLREVFERYGTIEAIFILKARGAQTRTGAFIMYTNRDDAAAAVAAIAKGYEIRPGQGNIIVTLARAKDSRRRPY